MMNQKSSLGIFLPSVLTGAVIFSFIGYTLWTKHEQKKIKIRQVSYKTALRSIYDAALVKANRDQNLLDSSTCSEISPFGYFVTCSFREGTGCIAMLPPKAEGSVETHNYSFAPSAQKIIKTPTQKKCVIAFSDPKDYGLKVVYSDPVQVGAVKNNQVFKHQQSSNFAYGFDLGDTGLLASLKAEKFNAVSYQTIIKDNVEVKIWQSASIWAIGDNDADYQLSKNNEKNMRIEFPLSGTPHPNLSYFGRGIFLDQETGQAQGAPGVIKFNPGE